MAARLHVDDLVSDGVPYQIGQRTELHFSHDVAAMRFGSLHADSQLAGHFLVAATLGEELNDLALTSRQSRHRVVTGGVVPQIAVQDELRDLRREEGSALDERLHGTDECTASRMAVNEHTALSKADAIASQTLNVSVGTAGLRFGGANGNDVATLKASR